MANVFTITFDASPGLIAGSGSSITVMQTDENGQINPRSLPESVRDGYLLQGWFEARIMDPGLHFPIGFDPSIEFPSKVLAGTKQVDFTTRVFTENTTVFAAWTQKTEPIVNFYVNDNLYDSIKPDINSQILDPPAAPNKALKVFVGWSYAASYETLVDFSTAVFTEAENLWAMYGINVNVTFNGEGGKFSNGALQMVKTTDIYGRIPNPEIPVKGIDWEFDYWYVEGAPDTPIELTTHVFTDHTTLHAKWIKLESKVTFDPNGGGWTEDDVFTTDPKVIPLGTNNKPVEIPDNPEKKPDDLNSYEFLHWTLPNGTIITDISAWTTDESVTLYAAWQDLATIVIDANGGDFFFEVEDEDESTTTLENIGNKLTFIVDAQTSLSGDVLIPLVLKDKGEFNYWSYDIEGTKKIEENLLDIVWEHNTHVYAIWRDIYTVTYDANGGSFSSGTITFEDILSGESATPPTAPSRPNAKFVGWALSPTAEKEDVIDVAKYKITSNITFYAVWEKVITILFNAGEGKFVNGLSHVSREAFLGYVEPPTDPVRDGWEFRGWSRSPEAELGSAINVAAVKFNQDTVLYAIWKYIVYVTFEPNGGEFLPGTTTKLRVTEEGLAVLPLNTPTRSGYTFKGWGFKADSTQPIDLSTQIFEEQTVLYAIWKLIVYVTFDANGGSFPDGTESTVIRASETGYLTPPQNPVRNGHSFVGWGTTRTSTDPIDIPNTAFEEILTLYAIWERVFISAIEFGFYDSLKGDRRYDAKDISSIFDGIIFDGLSATNYATNNNYYQVEPAGSGRRVIVKSGKAWFDHTYSINTADIMLQLTASSKYNRYDAIVLEVNRATRVNSVKVIKGVENASSPKPNITFTDKIHQYLLAWVRVRPGASEIKWSDIDNRAGLSTQLTLGIMQVVPISTFTQYWNNWKKQFTTYFTELKKIVNQGTIDNILYDASLMVNIADKATISTSLTNDTLYLTKYTANQLLIKGVRKTGTIYAITNRDRLTQTVGAPYRYIYNLYLPKPLFYRAW